MPLLFLKYLEALEHFTAGVGVDKVVDSPEEEVGEGNVQGIVVSSSKLLADRGRAGGGLGRQTGKTASSGKKGAAKGGLSLGWRQKAKSDAVDRQAIHAASAQARLKRQSGLGPSVAQLGLDNVSQPGVLRMRATLKTVSDTRERRLLE